jgi:hypothetical protein
MLHKQAAYDDGTPAGKGQRRGWLMDMLDRMQIDFTYLKGRLLGLVLSVHRAR